VDVNLPFEKRSSNLEPGCFHVRTLLSYVKQTSDRKGSQVADTHGTPEFPTAKVAREGGTVPAAQTWRSTLFGWFASDTTSVSMDHEHSRPKAKED
jgi:hypothetical protein